MKKYLLMMAVIILSSCATVNPQQSLNYEGNIALDRSEYEAAKKKFHASLSKAKSNDDRQYTAIAMYGLGRSYGYLCEFEEAEKWFKKSIELREKLPNINHAYLSQNIMELARLYNSANKYKEASMQFEKAIPILEKLNIRSADPIGYAGVLDDYVLALKSTGEESKSKEITQLINELRKNNVNRKAGFVPVQYPDNCKI